MSVRLAVSLRFTSGALRPNFSSGRSVLYHVLQLVELVGTKRPGTNTFCGGSVPHLFRGVHGERLYEGLFVARLITFWCFATVPLHIPYSVLVEQFNCPWVTPVI